jgi:transcriptional regulator with XRE-family HTH domain
MSREGIAKALRYFRLRSGKTAAEVARIVGKSEKTVYAWETCNGQPDADTLLLLCDLYGIKDFGEFRAMSDEAGEAGTNDVDRILEAYHKDHKLAILFSRSAKLKPADLDMVLKLIERMDDENDDDP